MKSLTHLALKYVLAFHDRHGKWRHYFRRAGYKRPPLPGAVGSSEFMAAYQLALTGETAPRIEIGAAASKPGTVAAAIANYLASADFNNLAIDTRKDRRRLLDRFREAHGGKPLLS
jgi:hypothetical protein